MTLLAISPDFASHYLPMAAAAGAARDVGRRVIVATGPAMRARVEADGFEWRELRLAGGANTGIVDRTPAIDRFLAATRRGPIATLSLQARDRAEDLLWQPEAVVRGIAELCDRFDPDAVLVDHVSFGSTLAMRAIGRPFTTLVPGHPSQLPVAGERYGIPPNWPTALEPPADDLAELEALADSVSHAFTERWNSVLEQVAPHASPADDAFRACGHRVLFNSPQELQSAARRPALPPDHRFVGPLTRDEALPGA